MATIVNNFLQLPRDIFKELVTDVRESLEFLVHSVGFNSIWEEVQIWILPFEYLHFLLKNKRYSVVRFIGNHWPCWTSDNSPNVYLSICKSENLNTRRRITFHSQKTITKEDFSSDLFFKHLLHYNTSTPLRPFHNASPESMLLLSRQAISKIMYLENELLKLKEQIKYIQSVRDKTDCAKKEIPVLKSAVPPPPPLPSLLFATKIDSQIAQKKKRVRLMDCNSKENLPNFHINIQDINKVKLRKTERSPGGTPFKRKVLSSEDMNNPAYLIASALKSKFSHIHNESFEKSFDSPNCSSSWMDSFKSSSSSPSNNA